MVTISYRSAEARLNTGRCMIVEAARSRDNSRLSSAIRLIPKSPATLGPLTLPLSPRNAPNEQKGRKSEGVICNPSEPRSQRLGPGFA
ncbi:Hypothetical protein NTJ_02987 [Nesidiocoris tenuis]|uniref:Uncharacterized protein n=1 Tax=Nesidiocoris tenuis TaxID=355587 RepID=A0ABN7AG72_9HEMI|nr:Hypothetical protein NTJ_02987 [Nesidiocoris tenuis]